ncbi:MAG: hypothetical protein AB8B66_02385 [Rickettsiaceae bacterium]
MAQTSSTSNYQLGSQQSEDDDQQWLQDILDLTNGANDHMAEAQQIALASRQMIAGLIPQDPAKVSSVNGDILNDLDFID